MSLMGMLAIVLVVCLSAKIGFFALRCFGKLIPIALLGAGALIAGLAIFGHRTERGTEAYVGPWKLTGNVDWDDDDFPHVKIPHIEIPHVEIHRIRDEIRNEIREHVHGRAGDAPRVVDEHRESTPTWALVSLGAILIIAGSILAPRHRAKPRVLRAMTFVGGVAVCFALVSFFTATPRHFSGSHDRVVRTTADASRDRVARVEKSNSSASTPTAPTSKRKSTRAKRPSTRAASARAADESAVELPPRAGEIPVGEELAKSEEPAAARPTESPGPAETPPAPATPEAANVAEAATPEPSPAAAAAAPEASAPPSAEPATTAPVAANSTKDSPKTNDAPQAPAPPDAPAKSRPAWVESTGRLDGAVYRTSVKSGLWVDVPECQRALDQAIRREADHYVNEYLGSSDAASTIRVPLDYLRRHVVKSEFPEVVTVSVGPMQQIHALLEFDDAARADFHRRWRDAVLTNRLWYIGSGAGLVLALLGIFYSYLTLDLRTGGTHKNQLRLAATLVALIAAVSVLLVYD